MKIQNITNLLETHAPLALQESYDNCGLLVGDKNTECTGVLLSLDCTEEVIDEAIENKCNLVVAHHPIVFAGLKKFNESNYIEKVIIKAIKNDIAIYAAHTNYDNISNGVNHKIAEKLQIKNCKILLPKTNLLKKLITYVPETHHQQMLEALFEAGCGNIGNYENCSFNSKGTGTFKGNEASNPFIGKAQQLSVEPEVKIETVFLAHNQTKIIDALIKSHPYEEVAYDIYTLDNTVSSIGSGMVGELEKELSLTAFLEHVKSKLNAKVLKYTKGKSETIKKVAFCGGSGKFLLNQAIKSRADVFLTADIKYHEYFDAVDNIILVDIGHFETEQFTPEIFYTIIQNKFPTFAVRLSHVNTNPINYFY